MQSVFEVLVGGATVVGALVGILALYKKGEKNRRHSASADKNFGSQSVGDTSASGGSLAVGHGSTVNIHHHAVSQDPASHAQSSIRAWLGQQYARGQKLISELADPQRPSPHGEVNEWLWTVQDFLKLNISLSTSERFREHAGITNMSEAVTLYGDLDLARRILWQEMYVRSIRLREIIDEIDSSAISVTGKDDEEPRRWAMVHELLADYVRSHDNIPPTTDGQLRAAETFINERLRSLGERWRLDASRRQII